MAAYEATKKSGFYEKNPGRETPIKQMMGKAPTENSKGVRLVNLPQVRDIENEEFEAMLAGQQTAQQALDNAVERGNAAIQAGDRHSNRPIEASDAVAARASSGQSSDDAITVRRRNVCQLIGLHATIRSPWTSMTDASSFPTRSCPICCVAPQLAITLVFFYWPASQALYQSMLREDPFGLQHQLRRARQFPTRCCPTRPISTRSRSPSIFSCRHRARRHGRRRCCSR